MTLSAGDFAVLKSSGRIFQVIDEKQERKAGEISLTWFECVRFFDDPRHPQWFEHPQIAVESRSLTDAERMRHAETISRWTAVLVERKAAATACMTQWFGPEKPLVVIDPPKDR